jgi:hypothetical protein
MFFYRNKKIRISHLCNIVYFYPRCVTHPTQKLIFFNLKKFRKKETKLN